MSCNGMIHTLAEALREEKKAKELLISRLRLMIVLLALMPPAFIEFFHPGVTSAAQGLLLVAWGLILGYAAGIYLLLKKDFYRFWIGYLTLFCDAIGLGLYLMALAYIKPGYIGALHEPLFAVYYIISVSGTIKYDFKYSFMNLAICALMVFVMVHGDAVFHGIPIDYTLVGEKLLMLGVFTIIALVFHAMFTRIVIAEHQLMTQRVKEISTILTIGSDISSRRKLDKTLANIVQETQALLQADLAYLAWLGEGGKADRDLVTSGTRTDTLDALRISPGLGLEGRLLVTGAPLMIDAPEELHRLSGGETHLAAEEVCVVLGVPLTIEGNIIGVFIVGRRSLSPFNDYDRVLLSTLSQQAALTIQNTALFTHLQKEQTPATLAEVRPSFEGMLGGGERMQRLYSLIQKAARTDHPVLIRGESGTGKELVARALHARSRRAGGPFIAINCSAIPETLLESELFGHERGAFTGATRLKKGRFELAHGGTIFLDEIGDMSLNLQAKLLRVLQTQAFERLGGETPIEVDIRVISATHQDLEQRMRAGAFREDLFYRISTLTVPTPPLRERREDIPPLIEHFIAEATTDPGKRPRLSQGALDYLVGRDWKGNVRELENAIKRMTAISEKELLRSEDIKELFVDEPTDPEPPMTAYVHRVVGEGCSLSEETRRLERAFIEQALRHSGGNISEAARLLKLPKTTLFNKLQKFNLAFK